MQYTAAGFATCDAAAAKAKQLVIKAVMEKTDRSNTNILFERVFDHLRMFGMPKDVNL